MSKYIPVVKDHIEKTLANWQGKPIYSSYYEGGLSTFLSNEELMEILKLKREYRDKSSHIDDQYLLELTKPLRLSRIYLGKRRNYIEYHSKIAGEIVEYKALVDMRSYLHEIFEERFENKREVRRKVQQVFQNDLKISHRSPDRLIHQLILRVDMLADDYLRPYNRRHHAGLASYILAKTGIISDPIKCPEKGRNRYLECIRVKCLEKRFIALERQQCIEQYDPHECSACEDKQVCPSYHPCPPGAERYKTELQRKIKAAEDFIRSDNDKAIIHL